MKRSSLPGFAAALLFVSMLSGRISAARVGQNPKKPDVVQIGDERFRVGSIVVDLKKGVATCPGRINMQRGTIEYLAVGPGGKLHESALRLETEAVQLQVALILLGLEPGGGLRFQGDTHSPKGSPIVIRVSWTRNGRSVTVPAGELVWDIRKRRAVGASPWVFTGWGENDRYEGEDAHSLVATYRDPAAVANISTPEGVDDTVYKVNERVAPPRSTPVTVTLSRR